VIGCFNRTVKIPRCFDPIHFVRTIARWQNRLDFNRNRLCLRALRRRIRSIEVVDESFSGATVRDVCVNEIDCFTLRDSISCDQPEILYPIEDCGALHTILVRAGFTGKP